MQKANLKMQNYGIFIYYYITAIFYTVIAKSKLWKVHFIFRHRIDYYRHSQDQPA